MFTGIYGWIMGIEGDVVSCLYENAEEIISSKTWFSLPGCRIIGPKVRLETWRTAASIFLLLRFLPIIGTQLVSCNFPFSGCWYHKKGNKCVREFSLEEKLLESHAFIFHW